jgi:glycosyltransferase involved in cell wall biosynthesis
MRILFIGPLPEPITGQSLACQILLEELEQYHLVDVININKSSLKSGVAGGRLGRVLEVLGFVWQAWRLSRHCDIVYFTISESVAGNLKDLLIYCACAGRLSGMAVHLHGGAGMKVLLRDKLLLAKLNRYFWKRMGAVILLGQRHLTLMNGLPDEWRRQHIHLIPNFAQDFLFRSPAEIDAKFGAPGPLRIVFLSNMIPGKGHEELLAAYCSLNVTEQSQIQLEFAGAFESSAARDDFLNHILKIPQVSYHGVVGGDSKANLLGRAHVFCLPTYYPYEGQPISILEAYASGCAVITTDHSGIFDVFVPDVCGLTVEPRSVNSLTAALRRCLADRAKLHAQAHHNRQLAHERYRVTTYTSRLLSVLSKLDIAP